MKNARCIFPVVLAGVALGPVVARAQSPDSRQTAQELRQQLDELRSRIDAIQVRLDRLESANAAAATQSPSGQPAPSLPAAPSRQVGKETASHQTFSEDPGAAPRLNNAPLDPTYRQYFRIPGTQTLMKIGGFFKSDQDFGRTPSMVSFRS